MTDPAPDQADSLAVLRREIDAVDAELHRLLIRRGEVIERLIAAKRGAPTGSAFRPDREAEMITRLAARHSGRLPLATVEHIWREIIGTFTQLQAPFRVHAAATGRPEARDLLRFHFGFATPVIDQPSPAAVVAGIKQGATDLGVVPIAWNGEAWWELLDTDPDGVRAIAVLPFLTAADGWPRSLVLGPSAISNPAADVTLLAAECQGPVPTGRASDLVEVIALADGHALLAHRGATGAALADAAAAGLDLSGIRAVGDYCSAPSQSS
jgi:chorismate mutase / prephenate dehydratase